MNTDDLVALLARSAARVDRGAADRQLVQKLSAAAALSVLAVLVMLGPRPDLAGAIAAPMFWVKLAFPAATAVVAFVALRRLGHPGRRLRWSVLALGVPVAIVWFMAAAALAATPPADRLALVLGSSSWRCTVFIAALSLPAFLLAVQALGRLAPTRLALSGTIAGLFAGSTAACAYALHCTEMQPPFLAVWYVLGMLIPAAAGALAGRRLLHW